MPTISEEKDAITLKNHLQEADDILSKTYDLGRGEVDAQIEKIRKEVGSFRHQSPKGTGLAIFTYDNTVEVMELQGMHVPSKLYVDDHLYLVPLSGAVEHSNEALLLVLSAQHTMLYEVSEKGLNIHPASDTLPSSMKDVVGHDVEQKALQFRQGQQGSEGGDQSGIYHGQGSGSDSEQKEEYTKYFRAVDSALTDHVDDHSKPMYVACVKYLFPIYQEVSSYPNLHSEALEGNFDDHSESELFDAIKPEIQKRADRAEQREMVDFDAYLSKQLASYKDERIVEAAYEGRVDTLIIQRDAELWGQYDRTRASAQVENLHTVDNASLVNLAAVKTIEYGGEVMLVDKEDMPASERPMNAVFRYDRG